MGWGEPHGPTTGELESMDRLLTKAGVPNFDCGRPLTLLERLEWLVEPTPDPFRLVTCERCDVSFGRSPEVRDALDRFRRAHRHRQPAGVGG